MPLPTDFFLSGGRCYCFRTRMQSSVRSPVRTSADPSCDAVPLPVEAAPSSLAWIVIMLNIYYCMSTIICTTSVRRLSRPIIKKTYFRGQGFLGPLPLPLDLRQTHRQLHCPKALILVFLVIYVVFLTTVSLVYWEKGSSKRFPPRCVLSFFLCSLRYLSSSYRCFPYGV